MNNSFYKRIARTNLLKNYRFYIPQILTGMGLLGSYYIMLTLTLDKRVLETRGGNYIPILMFIGIVVMTVLSIILILYTNNFIMKQRKSEFGLYNVLGMEKEHITKVLFYESFYINAISIVLGVGFGMLFYKLCSMLIIKLLGEEIAIGYSFITLKSLVPSVLFFIVVYLIAYLKNVKEIKKLKPVELLESKHAGEKEPKVKWVTLILGIITLGLGYYMALTVVNPISAMLLFMVAVLLVIAGTYLLFQSLSIFILKALKNNKKYYYKRNHMNSVSGLIYRMKQNGVGLASITILATGVLVMLSTTISLYAGMSVSLNNDYPEDLYVSAKYADSEGNYHRLDSTDLNNILNNVCDSYDLEISNVKIHTFLDVACSYSKGEIVTARPGRDTGISDLANLTIITLDEYNRMGNDMKSLKEDEILVCTLTAGGSSLGKASDTLAINGNGYVIKENLATFPIGERHMIAADNYGIVVANSNVLSRIFYEQKEAYGKYASEMTTQIGVKFKDYEKVASLGKEFDSAIYTEILRYIKENYPNYASGSFNVDSKWTMEEENIGLNGTLLFLGIILGLVCTFATVLIIYYKQISEGYEDRLRFQIMEKIGMSGSEIRKTVNSQLSIVFFLPIIVSGIHISFAFPMLTKMLRLLLLSNMTLFFFCTLGVYIAFLIIYFIIYSMTAKTYYKIVY